ncbi:hypothetical protein ACHAXR_012530 [Thalassiosira sp. AJA248-18]
MEEYDDLAAGPTDGAIDLSHNTWKTLPPELNDFSTTLLHLEMSNNQLTSIPESIGNLVLLQTLNVSLNQIENIDGAIGKCIRLRRLNVAKNRIESFPAEIGNCMLLEDIIASDNRLNSLPKEFLHLFVISVIDVRNNRLAAIPTELSRVPTLTQLLCDGNPQLASAPENMRGDSNLLVFCLEMQQKFKDVIDPKEAQYDEQKAKNDELNYELSLARSQIQQLEKDVASLEWDRPDRYIYWKGRFLAFICYVLGKINQLWGGVKKVFLDWRDRRKTHPLY